ncbi:hypothetical protein PM082_013762 [Marasmius tenuissimus]|nr:hypothetical protein PM082_013762 [Marasmius tenuissimus]
MVGVSILVLFFSYYGVLITYVYNNCIMNLSRIVDALTSSFPSWVIINEDDFSLIINTLSRDDLRRSYDAVRQSFLSLFVVRGYFGTKADLVRALSGIFLHVVAACSGSGPGHYSKQGFS